jgi:hypothetical protein
MCVCICWGVGGGGRWELGIEMKACHLDTYIYACYHMICVPTLFFFVVIYSSVDIFIYELIYLLICLFLLSLFS